MSMLAAAMHPVIHAYKYAYKGAFGCVDGCVHESSYVLHKNWSNMVNKSLMLAPLLLNTVIDVTVTFWKKVSLQKNGLKKYLHV